jgi:hypothetical protein
MALVAWPVVTRRAGGADADPRQVVAHCIIGALAALQRSNSGKT